MLIRSHIAEDAAEVPGRAEPGPARSSPMTWSAVTALARGLSRARFAPIALILLVGTAWAAPPKSPCAGYGTAVVVQTAEHKLHLCKNEASQAHYTVVFGWKGVGKARRGDRKTPLGTYRLGRPRPSAGKKFHTFIPIEIPKRMGSAVGIHGPHRALRWLGTLGRMADVTDGCIAVALVPEIIAIADFVKREKVSKIHILPKPAAAPKRQSRGAVSVPATL